MTRLRTYAPMRRQSKKLVKAQKDYRAVYRVVDQRSEGQCEYNGLTGSFVFTATELVPAIARCTRRAMDHHHLFKPRWSHHDSDKIVHLCRFHHDRCAWPYKRGRLVVTMLAQGRFSFAIRFAADKFAARETT